MIPFIRSLNELMVITQPRNQQTTKDKRIYNNCLCEDSAQRKRYIRSMYDYEVAKPSLQKSARVKWIKRKEVMSRTLNYIDDKSQMNSSYNITLLDSQKNYANDNAA